MVRAQSDRSIPSNICVGLEARVPSEELTVTSAAMRGNATTGKRDDDSYELGGRRHTRGLCSRLRRAWPVWTRRNTLNTRSRVKNNWPPEALPEIPDVSRREEDRPGRREAVLGLTGIRPNRRSRRNKRRDGTTSRCWLYDAG